MGKFRGLDTDPGWQNRRFADLQRQITELAAARRLPFSEITSGGVTVKDGGSINVQDGGDINLNSGGTLNVIGTTSYAVVAAGNIGVRGLPSNFPASFLDENGLRVLPSSGSAVRFQRSPTTGTADITGPGLTVPVTTTSSGANAYIDIPTRLLMTVTSSRRYKDNIEDVVVDPAAVLKMQGRTWRDKAEAERDPDTTKRHVGFIAEELDDLGLTEFVEYNAEGQPDAIQYDRLSVALLAVLKDQERRLRRVEGIVAR